MAFLQLGSIILGFYILGLTDGALLKTCEGESLLGCLNEADAILQNVQLTFPADESSLTSVCKMWMDMTECIHGYTTKCLTAKEITEFHNYFEVPMTSMIIMCTNGNLTARYFRQANCIKRISMEENFCGNQYKVLVSEITGGSRNGVKNICCALENFKDCVTKVKMQSVCGGQTETDVVNTTLVALEKSLLTFVMHSCDKESYRSAGCESTVQFGSDTKDAEIEDLQFVDAEQHSIPRKEGTDNSPAYAETLATLAEHRPLLMPLDHELHWGKVNVTNMGEIGNKRRKFIGKGQIPRTSSYNRGYATATDQEKTLDVKHGSEEEKVAGALEDFKAVPTGNTNFSKAEDSETGSATLEASRVFINASGLGGSSFNYSTEIERRNGSRLNGGRSLDQLDPYLIESEGGTGNISSGSQGFFVASPVDPIIPNVTGGQGVPQRFGAPTVMSTTLATKTEDSRRTWKVMEVVSSTSAPKSEISKKKIEFTTFRSSSSTMNPLVARNQFLGLPWMITTTYVPLVRKKGKGRDEISKQLDLNATETRMADGLKGNGGSTTSRVPLRVFMVWLSTFFV